MHCCCSVAKSCPTLWTPWTAACQAPLSSTISQSLLRFMSIESVVLSNHLILCRPLLVLSSIFPRINESVQSINQSNESVLCISGQSIGALASVLPVTIQDWFPLGLTGLIYLQSKGLSRVFSNTIVQSKNSLVLSLHYGPILTSIHDHWKNHSFDRMDLCQQNDVSAFQYTV